MRGTSAPACSNRILAQAVPKPVRNQHAVHRSKKDEELLHGNKRTLGLGGDVSKRAGPYSKWEEAAPGPGEPGGRKQKV